MAVTEGNYLEYTLKWTSATLQDLSNILQKSTFSSDESKAMLSDNGIYFVIVQISDGTLLSENTNYTISHGEIQWFHSSRYGKYFAAINNAEDTLRIYKDGVLLHDDIHTDDYGGAGNDTFEGLLVSPTGQYIILLHRDNGTGNETLRCYESPHVVEATATERIQEIIHTINEMEFNTRIVTSPIAPLSIQEIIKEKAYESDKLERRETD